MLIDILINNYNKMFYVKELTKFISRTFNKPIAQEHNNK